MTSSLGNGSTFRFEIPVGRGEAGVALKTSPARRVVAIQAGQEAPKVLVVDDHPDNRDWLMKLLRSIGFSVRGADNGEAAIQRWEEWSPQLILMDVHMPVMDGIEATRRIKSDPRGKQTSIVALTASAMDQDRRIAAESGADDFLAKPCLEGELLEKLRTLLGVVFDYEEMSQSGDRSLAGGESLSTERLAQLPRELIQEIRKATSRGNKKLLDELILKVPEPESAGALQRLADKYDYDALARLLEEAWRP